MANEFIARKGLIALEDSQITGSLNISSTLIIPGFSDVSASLAAAVAGGDNLGNHTATEDLNMGGNNITSVGNVDGVDVSSLNSSFNTLKDKTLVSSSAQIASDISGSFNATSASFSTRVATNERITAKTLISSSAQFGSSDNVTFGTIEATSLNVTSITSSIVTSSIVQTEGSNIFGDTSADTHTFNGKIIAINDISASGTIIGSNLSGTNTGDQDLSSYIQASQTSSFLTAADTGSLITAAQTSSFSTATGVEDNADVTDTANVTSAGALMDSELAEIATIKALTAAGISGSFTAVSASFSTRVAANEVITAKTLVSSSAQINSLINDTIAATIVAEIDNDEIPIAKLAEDAVTVTAGAGLSGGGSVTLGGSITINSDGLLSSSAQIASDISGSFTAASASFSTRVAANDAKVSYTDAAVTNVINTAGVISSSAQLDFVDTTGTPAGNQLAVFTDADTIKGASVANFTNEGGLIINNASLAANRDGITVHGNIFGSGSHIRLRNADGGGGSGFYLSSSGDIAGATFKLSLGDIDNQGNNTTLIIDDESEQITTSKTLGVTGNITVTGTVDGRDVAADGTKLDGITAAGISGSFTATSASFSTRISTNESNISTLTAATSSFSTATGVENNADVTDTSNVTAAGALMDSELAEIATVKALTKAGISGSFTVTSASFSTRVAANEVITAKTLVSSSAQIADVTLTTAAQTNITSLGTLTTLTVDDITINGSTISDGADLTIDAEGDITLDANGADIILSDDGTDFGRFKRDSSDFVIKSETNNKDIVFRGVDDSSTITALTLDMSDAGHALFTGDISGSTIRTSGDIVAGGKITGSHFLINPASAAANELLFEIIVGSTQKVFIDEDGDASFDGTITCDKLQVSSDGTTSSPAIKFGTDINTGILQPADNKIAIQADGGTAELTVSTDGVEITNGDFIINETIVHSGDTNTKIDFTTDNIQLDAGGTTGLELDITGSILHNVKQNIFDTGSIALGANGAIGDVVKFGNTTTSAGGIYYLKGDGTWGLAQANAASTATGSLAIAVGTNSTTHGMCLRGFINPFSDPGAGIGSPVYLSDGFAGRFISTAPDSNNDVVRILGHQYGTDLIYFNPSNDFIVITA